MIKKFVKKDPKFERQKIFYKYILYVLSNHIAQSFCTLDHLSFILAINSKSYKKKHGNTYPDHCNLPSQIRKFKIFFLQNNQNLSFNLSRHNQIILSFVLSILSKKIKNVNNIIDSIIYTIILVHVCVFCVFLVHICVLGTILMICLKKI